MKLNSLFILLVVFWNNVLLSQNIFGELEHDGLTRTYRLHLPTGYNSSEHYPLVFNFHGANSNANEQIFYTEMNEVADVENFIVCYPEGNGGVWNTGLTGGSSADDIGFVESLIEELLLNYSINEDKIYACGFSQGGFLTYQLACELGDKIAAVASVAGGMPAESFLNCNPARSIPVLAIHGTEDKTVPYYGLPNIIAPVENTIDFWVENNACSNLPSSTPYPDIYAFDESTANRFDYTMCTEGAKVSFIKIENGEHTWAGSVVMIGTANQDINASEVIWEFFNEFDLNGTLFSNSEDLEENKDWILFPNPANNNIVLDNLSRKKGDVFIFNSHGQMIKAFSIKGEERQILDIKSLNYGIYSLFFQNESGIYQRKFVKL